MSNIAIIMSHNTKLSPYLCSRCSAWAAFFPKPANFEWSSRRNSVSYMYDIFHDKCKGSHLLTCKKLCMYIETKYQLLILQYEFRLLNKGEESFYYTGSLYCWLSRYITGRK